MPERTTGKALNLDRTLEQYDSKFRFVLLASARAEQLTRGARPKVTSFSKKPTRLAMEELKEGVVEWGYGLPVPPEVAEPAEGDQAAAVAGETDGSPGQH